MILYQNNLLKLDYYPANSLIEVNWPNLEPYTLPDARLALTRLVNSIRSYDVKNLLIDASRITTSNLSPDQYKEVVSDVMQMLQKTNLKRIARIKSEDQDREGRAASLATANGFPFEFMNFPNREEALNWVQIKTAKLPETAVKY